MSKETINTNNKFVIPSSGDNGSDEARKQLIEDLQKIKPEEVHAMADEMYIVKLKGKLTKRRGPELDADDAIFLIEKGNFKLILDTSPKFEIDNYIPVRSALVKYLSSNPEKINGGWEDAFHYFGDKNSMVAKMILDTNNEKLINGLFNHMSLFKQLDETTLQSFMDNGLTHKLITKMNHLEKKNYDVWKDLEKIILILIEKGYSPDIGYLLCIGDEEFEDKIIKLKKFKYLALKMPVFPTSTHKRIILKIIKAGGLPEISDCIDNFTNLDKEVIMCIFDTGYYQGKTKKCNFKSFKGLDKDVAMRILNDEQLSQFVEWVTYIPEMFSGLDSQVAKILIKKGYSQSLSGGLKYYHNLDDEVANSLIDAGYGASVKKFKDTKFTGLRLATKIRLMRAK